MPINIKNGDFNSERILRVLETNFRRSESSPQQNGVVINQRNASHVERRRSLEQAHFRFGCAQFDDIQRSRVCSS